MNAFLVLLCVLSQIHAQCIPGLLTGFPMDDLGGLVLHDSTALRQNITLNSSLYFTSVNNPQGVSALVFRGNSQLVLNPFPRPPQYTVTMWFLTSDQGESALFSWVETVVGYTLYARIIQGKIGVAINTIMTTQTSSRNYNDGRWHFLCVSYNQDNQLLTVTIDPHTSAEVLNIVTGVPRPYTVFQIGGIATRDDLAFVGQMDDFRVYGSNLALVDMQRIALQLDSSCTASLLGAQQGLYQSWIPANSPTTLLLDTTQSSVCGTQGGYNSQCSNNRYGVAITACAGSLAGFATKVIVGSTVYTQKDVTPSLSSCAVGYDSTRYPSASGVDSNRLCMSSSRTIVVSSQVNPISGGSVNQVTFVSGATSLRVQVSTIVADPFNNYSPVTKSFPAQTPVLTCNAGYINARWAIPVLNNGLTCNSCTYQAWYSPLSLVIANSVNLASVCGVKLYGNPLPDTFNTPYYDQFVLPASVPVQGDNYVWVIIATSPTDSVEGVVAVLNGCPSQSASVAPSPAPTWAPGTFTHNDINSNTLVLSLLAQDFPAGPPRDAFTNQFVTSMATVLNTDPPRFNVTSFTPTAADKVAVGFNIGLPIPGGDNRTAGALALNLYNQHNNKSSMLYSVLPNTDPDRASFSSSYEAIPSWTQAAAGPAPFHWKLITIIIGAILAAILCCCLIYCCYHRHRKEEKPRQVVTTTTTTRMRGVEIEPQYTRTSGITTSGITTSGITTSGITTRPQRFYDDEDKHTTHSDHINFPQMRSPTTRTGSDLATAKRLATSPDTRNEVTVSYRGTTLSSADDGPAPHLDPRDWKTVVALHGRNGTVDKGDLPFKLGDTIRVVGPCDGPHWFEGELESTGQRGMVPVNHVRGQIPIEEVRVYRTVM